MRKLMNLPDVYRQYHVCLGQSRQDESSLRFEIAGPFAGGNPFPASFVGKGRFQDQLAHIEIDRSGVFDFLINAAQVFRVVAIPSISFHTRLMLSVSC